MASVSTMGITAVMLIVEMAWLRRLGRSPSQIALAITEVAIASSRGVIRRDPVGRYAVTRGACAPDCRPGGWHMAACAATGKIEQRPLNCAGRVVMGCAPAGGGI